MIKDHGKKIHKSGKSNARFYQEITKCVKILLHASFNPVKCISLFKHVSDSLHTIPFIKFATNKRTFINRLNYMSSLVSAYLHLLLNISKIL